MAINSLITNDVYMRILFPGAADVYLLTGNNLYQFGLMLLNRIYGTPCTITFVDGRGRTWSRDDNDYTAIFLRRNCAVPPNLGPDITDDESPADQPYLSILQDFIDHFNNGGFFEDEITESGLANFNRALREYGLYVDLELSIPSWTILPDGYIDIRVSAEYGPNDSNEIWDKLFL